MDKYMMCDIFIYLIMMILIFYDKKVFIDLFVDLKLDCSVLINKWSVRIDNF